jgi:hypothetical protein
VAQTAMSAPLGISHLETSACRILNYQPPLNLTCIRVDLFSLLLAKRSLDPIAPGMGRCFGYATAGRHHPSIRPQVLDDNNPRFLVRHEESMAPWSPTRIPASPAVCYITATPSGGKATNTRFCLCPGSACGSSSSWLHSRLVPGVGGGSGACPAYEQPQGLPRPCFPRKFSGHAPGRPGSTRALWRQ